MWTCTCGAGRRLARLLARYLAIWAVATAVLVGGACSKKTQKTKQSSGKTGLAAEVVKPTPKKGTTAPNRIVLQRVDNNNKAPVGSKPAASASPPVAGGVASNKAPMAGGGPALAGPNTPAPTVTSATITPTLNVIAGVNVAQIRKTFLWKAIMADPTFKKIFAGKPYQVITKIIGLDPTKVTDEIVVALGSRTWNFATPEHAVVIFKGRFDTAKVMVALKRLPVGQLGHTKSVRFAGKDGLAVSTPGFLPFVLIAVKKNVFAFSSVALAPNVAKQLPGFGDATAAARLKKIDRKALVWGTFGRLGSFFAGRSMSPSLGAISDITGGTFVVSLKKARWNGVTRIDLATLQAAEGLTTLLSMGQAAFAAGGTKGSPRLIVSLIQKIKIARQTKSIVASVTLSKSDAKGIAALMLRMMR